MSITPPLKTELMHIFFDESGNGNNSDRPSTMGGLLIPNLVYNTAEMLSLNQKLRSKEIKLLWKDYTGDSKLRENIKEAINRLQNTRK